MKLAAGVKLDAIEAEARKGAHRAGHYGLDQLRVCNVVLGAATVVQIPSRLKHEAMCLVDHGLRIWKALIPDWRAVFEVKRVVLGKALVPATIKADVNVAKITQRHRLAIRSFQRGVHEHVHGVLHDLLRWVVEGIEVAPPHGRC